MTEPKKKVHHVQVDFTENGYAQLLKLKDDAGSETVSDLIQTALRVLRVAIKERE